MTFRNKLVEKNAIPLATPLPLEQRQRQRQRQQHQIPNPQTNQAHIGVPGVISGQFSVREIATTSPSVSKHDYTLKKQHVMLYVTTHAGRDVTVLDSKTSSVIPVYRPL
jgi:hypothetical protein